MISAINVNSVIVNITEAADDMLAQEVEVKNGAGVVVPTKPLDIAKGDKIAEFEFVTAVKAADLVGVWTVNGKSYDLDLFTKLDNFLSATTQVKLNAALNALDIKNVEIANLPQYKEAQEELALTVESKDLTVEDVQKLVNDVNAENLTAEEEEVLVKAIVKAAKVDHNKVMLLAKLGEANVTPLNGEWAQDYETALDVVGITDASSLKDIQKEISDVNDAKAAAVTVTGIDKAVLTKSLALIEDYATVDKDGKYTDGAVVTAEKAVKKQLALVEVLEATIPSAFKTKLTALAKLDDPVVIDMDDYIDANGKAYIKALKDETDVSKKNTVTLVEDILFGAVNGVNKAQEDGLVLAVTTAATNIETAEGVLVGSTTSLQKTALLKALNDLGVKQVTEANITNYIAVATQLKAITDLDTAQTQVDTANLAAVTAANKNTIISKLNVFGIDNIVAANAEAYATASSNVLTATVGANHKATVKAVKDAVDADNKVVIEKAELKAINKATTVAEVKTALDKLADAGVTEVAKYITIRSADREFVAAYALNARDTVTETNIANKEFTNLTGLKTQLDLGVTAHGGSLDLINAVEVDTAIETVVAALESTLDEAYNKLSPTQKVNAAEAFQAKLTFKEDGKLKTPFVTLAAAKALLK